MGLHSCWLSGKLLFRFTQLLTDLLPSHDCHPLHMTTCREGMQPSCKHVNMLAPRFDLGCPCSRVAAVRTGQGLMSWHAPEK